MANGYGVDTYGLGVYGGTGGSTPSAPNVVTDWPIVIHEVAWAWDPFQGRLSASVNLNAGQKTYITLGAVPDYVVQSGDCLEYDVYWPAASQYLALDLYNTTDAVYLRSVAGVVDQGGLAASPATDLSGVAVGAWYHRVIQLPASWVGKTISLFDLAVDLSVGGTTGVKTGSIRDAMISDGLGNARVVIWGQGNGLQGPVDDTVASTVYGNWTMTVDPPLSGAPVWVPLGSRVRESVVTRGRQRELDVIEAGTMDLTCDNNDRVLDPSNTLSPLYPNILPMRMGRKRCIYPGPSLLPYGGFIDSIPGTFGNWITFLAGAATLAPAASASFEGSLGALGTGAASGDTGTVQSLFSTPIDPTKPYTLTAYLKKVSGTANAHSRLRVICFRADGGGLGAVYPSLATSGVTLSSPTDFDPTSSFVRYGGVIQPSDWPVGTVCCKVEVSPVRNPTSAISVAADALQIEQGSVATAFSQGWHYDRFTGYLLSFPSEQHGRRNQVSLHFADAMYLFAQATTNIYRPQQSTADRIGSVLLDTGLPKANYLATLGFSQVQPLGLIAGTNTEINVLQHIQETIDAELGLFYIDAAGNARFIGRRFRQNTTPSWAVYDQPTAASLLYFYSDLVPITDPDLIYNYISYQPFSGGSVYIAQDYASIRKYGKRTLEGSPPLATADEAQQRANYLLTRYREPVMRFDAMLFEPARVAAVLGGPGGSTAAAAQLWADYLNTDIGARLTVQRTPPGGGSATIRDVYVERMTETVSSRPGEARKWSTTFQLSPADVADYWVLGDPAASVLGSTTRLAY